MVFAALALFLPSCGTESAQRSAYEAMQDIGQAQCHKNPTADCPKRESYDDYQKKRKSE